MKKLVAIAVLVANAVYAQVPSADTKTFIQVCKQPVDEAQHSYCLGYIAGILDTSREIKAPGKLGDVLDATVSWMRSQELSTTPINKLMPINGMWVGTAVHDALLTLYPREVKKSTDVAVAS